MNIEEKNKTNGKKFIRTAAVLEKGSLFGVSFSRTTGLLGQLIYQGSCSVREGVTVWSKFSGQLVLQDSLFIRTRENGSQLYYHDFPSASAH